MQELEFVYESQTQTGITLWEQIKPILATMGELDYLHQHGNSISLRKFNNEVSSRKKAFGIETNSFCFNTSHSTSEKMQNFWVKKLDENNENWWQIWIDTFIQLDGFLQVHLYDDDYDTWQNVDNPETYDFYGKSYDHLPLKDNGLPFPLNATIIDTSNNPGARNICTGYIEAVGANMWISDKFLTLMNQDIETVNRNISATVEKVLPNVYHIAYPMDIFTDETTEKEQRELRKALFANPTNIPEESRDKSKVKCRAVNPKTGEVIEIHDDCD